MNRHFAGVAALSALLIGTGARAQDDPIARIIDQGMNHSQVMVPARALADGIGGRLTNSPAMRRAEAWALDTFRALGLRNVHRDPFYFGRGWSFTRASVAMIGPRPLTLHAIPVAWTPPTAGTMKGSIVVAPMAGEADFAAWRGRLRDRIVLFTPPGTESTIEPAVSPRLSAAEIAAEDHYDPPPQDDGARRRRFDQRSFGLKVDAFLKGEGAIAWIRMSVTDDGLVHGEGYDYLPGRTPQLPGFELAAKDYRRIARLAAVGAAPILELTSDARYDDGDPNAYNIVADLPGSDPRAGYVMAGAHLDSWVSGDGAADDGAGCADVIEAARILIASGVRPRRTIRFVLWSGEEQGLLGSGAYVAKYLASRPAPAEPENGIATRFYWPGRFPVTRRPGYDEMAAYFNIDGGSGRLRGIRAQNDVAAAPLLEQWLAPFASMGIGRVAMSASDNADHYYLRAVGLPAFGFLQDPLDYGRGHHSDLDTFDHLKADDMRQAATVLAGLLYQAATSDRRLPRQPIPTDPALDRAVSAKPSD